MPPAQPLFAAIAELLAKGASPNVPDERGWTAVHQAVSRGNVRMIEAVMAAGGDGGRPDREGKTPRDLARAHRRPDLLALVR
jgi:ankyrin repeat protein